MICFVVFFSQQSFLFFCFCSDDDSHGQFFHSKYFPTLKFFIHLGFDNELGKNLISSHLISLNHHIYSYLPYYNLGCLNFKELFLRDPPTSYIQQVAPTLVDDSPLYVQIKKG